MSGFDFCNPRNKTAWPPLFPNQNYNVPSPSFHIQVYVSDLCIPKSGLPIFKQPDRQGIYKLLTDTRMKVMGTRPRSFISGNT
jgi:hypothetical protein